MKYAFVLGGMLVTECENVLKCERAELQLRDAAQCLQDALTVGVSGARIVKKVGMMDVVTAIQQLIEERDELRSALCVARVNGRQQHGMTLRQFAVLCGRSPSWVSRWTSSDIDTPPDFVD